MIFGKRKKNVPNRRRIVSGDNSRFKNSTYYSSAANFRRNHTITGSLSTNVSSVSEENANLKSSRVKTHELRRHRRKIVLYLIGSIILCIALAWSLYQLISVPKVVVNGIENTKYEKIYKDAIQKYLYINFFQRNRSLIDIGSLTDYLQTNGFPEILSIDNEVKFAGLGFGQFNIKLRTPTVLWRVADKDVYVDGDGISFSRIAANNTDGIVEVVDETGVGITKDGNVLVSDRFLSVVGKAVGYFNSNNLNVKRAVLPINTTRQVFLYIDNVDYYIKVSMDRSAIAQAEDAFRSIVFFDKQGIKPTEYLDVRVGGKAFYK